jgi:hypothetical protein
MRNDYESLLVIVAELADKSVEILGSLAVQIACWFVGKNNVWSVDECPGDSYTLLFSTAKLVWLVLCAMF